MSHAPKHKCKPYFKRSRHESTARDGSGGGLWTVPELCAAYDWPANLAGGGVIAIVELDGGWVPSDMDAFFQSIGQPMPQITDVPVDRQNNPNKHIGEKHDPDLEVALDIQVAAAAYYAATGQPAVLRIYWASDIASAVQAAAADGCDVCSISWGADEALWGRDAAEQMEAAAQAATAAGMIVFAASGDNDSSDGGPTPANVDVPSSCPHVIGCGGTSKTPTMETVWNNEPGQSNGHGTGGGYSTIFPVQAFQVGAPPAPDHLGRMVPDVSADADPETGYWIYVHGEPNGAGGTSAVAPLYAGLFAAFGTKLGFVTPKLWANQRCFNDITQGDNGLYSAVPGPDPCTGIGSPIGRKLATLFAASTSSHVKRAGSPVTV